MGADALRDGQSVRRVDRGLNLVVATELLCEHQRELSMAHQIMTESTIISPTLATRPEARTYQIDNLLVRVSAGEFRVPIFQRGLKWDDSDRIELIDSVYRGYPIGTLLLWKHPAPASRIDFGGYMIDAPERSDALWIVDGQQRLASLASVLLNPLPAKKQMELVISPAGEVQFRYPRLRTTHATGTVVVPTHVLLDSSDVAEWCIDNKLQATSRRQVLDVAKRLREYQLSAYVVEGDNEQILREIFRRVNRSGKNLEETEVFEAIFGARVLRVPSLKGVSTALESLEFGSVSEEVVRQVVREIAGINHRANLVDELRKADVDAELTRAEDSLRRAIQFFKSEVGFIHVELIPYSTTLLLSALFFDRFPEPNPRSRILLRRWLWRGSLAGRLVTQSAYVAQIVRQITAGDENGSIQRLFVLLENLPGKSNEPIIQDAARADSARVRMLAASLAALEPRDLRTGEPIHLAKLLDQGLDTALTVIDPQLPKSDRVRLFHNIISV